MPASSRTPARLCLTSIAAFLLVCAGCSNPAADSRGEGDGFGDGVGDGEEGWTGDGGDGGDDGGDGDGGAKFDIGSGGDGDPDDGEPPDDEEGPDLGEVCDEENPVTLYLSPDDSNSMSAPVQAREAVLSGWNSLGAVALRTWEFFNYYTFDYPVAAPGELLLTVDMYQPDADVPGDFLLQIGVSSELVLDQDRAPMNVTLVLDASGSMTGEPMEMLKESCRAIAASLRAGDWVSMVTWDTSNAIVLAGHEVDGPNDPVLLQKISSIHPGGGTDLNGGLTAGYELALLAYDPERINRVVLMSDGGANAGVTDIELISQHAGSQNEDGIYLVGVGVGSAGTYHDELMDRVTDAGKGASVFIPDADEAWKVFGDDFVNTMSVAARDVQVRVDLPPGFKFISFSGEEWSEDPEEVEPQHIAPNDSVVFHQHITSCAPELLNDQSGLTVTASYKDAITFEKHEITQSFRFATLLDQSAPQLHKGAAVFAYVEGLRHWREAWDGAAQEAAIAEALAAVDVADSYVPGDPDLAEIREVLETIH
jgi:Ca-activated chloride channel family protein